MTSLAWKKPHAESWKVWCDYLKLQTSKTMVHYSIVKHLELPVHIYEHFPGSSKSTKRHVTRVPRITLRCGTDLLLILCAAKRLKAGGTRQIRRFSLHSKLHSRVLQYTHQHTTYCSRVFGLVHLQRAGVARNAAVHGEKPFSPACSISAERHIFFRYCLKNGLHILFYWQ